eukprot:symbB.v1.2.014146.t3/scaffold1025.1/size143318/6
MAGKANWFKITIGAVIFLNSVWLLAQAALPWLRAGSFVMDTAFLAVYVVETILRIGHWRLQFFSHPEEAGWNWFDLIIVLSGVLEEMETIEHREKGGHAGKELMALRVFKPLRLLARLARFMRVIRLCRVLVTADFSWVESPTFQSTVGVVIILNAVIMGLETDSESAIFEWTEQFMLAFFVMEAVLRIRHRGWDFFISPEDRGWNIVDFTIVASGVVDDWILKAWSFITQQQQRGGNLSKLMTLARLLRLMSRKFQRQPCMLPPQPTDDGLGQKADGLPMAESLSVNVILPSGRAAVVTVSSDSRVGDVKVLAQQQLRQGLLRLVGPDGCLLDPLQSLQDAGIGDGDCVSAIAQQAQLASTWSAFALWCSGGDRVVTWGNHGGDHRRVKEKLRQVHQLQSTGFAFAAIVGDGRVIAWGHPHYGGNSGNVDDRLRNVEQLQATGSAFCAILADETVVTWGDAENGGDSSEVQEELTGVKAVQRTRSAFAALKKDGTVVTWGDSVNFRNSRVKDQLRNVRQIQATSCAFAAILATGHVVTSGNAASGGYSNHVQDQLKDVENIQATHAAFAALTKSGDVATNAAFTALRVDGSCVAWGHPQSGGVLGQELLEVQQLQATSGAFAALCADGSVVTWGGSTSGGDSAHVTGMLTNVKQIQATKYAFAAIRDDGSVVSWGLPLYGGGNGPTGALIDPTQATCSVQSTDGAFAALLRDGGIATWGHSQYGGDSSGVQEMLKILRLVRVVRAIRPLYMLAIGVVRAMQSMFWVLVLTFVALYAIAILTTRAIGRGELLSLDADIPEETRLMFNTIADSMFALSRQPFMWEKAMGLECS